MTKTSFKLPLEPDPCPGLVVERGPKNEGVGSWVPEQKHTLLAKLLGGTRGARAKWSQRVLIDPFCGPGRIQVKGETMTRDGGAVVAWRQSVNHKTPFTQVLVGDLDPDRAEACRRRLAALGAPVSAFVGPASDTAKDMAKAVSANALALAYVDPYNLEYLSFDIIRALGALKRIDFVVHFSTMDLQRNVDMELDDARARFDDAAPGWREKLNVKGLSKTELRQAFFDYWTSLVGGLGFTFSEQAPLVRGDRNEPLYRLVSFSRHAFPNGIWDDVAKGDNRDLFDT
ncbi:three-Cys-motif partner protein TcmP [Roseateles sp. BYS78W]|uniref:Three-Cys-motif partner protein TcmP n=1 Tax=Pelomonas candidula TaxID=3299025 RepID=A0ABW7HEH8_9BURK